MGRPLDKDIIIKILERWQKAFKENSHYVSASDLSLVIKDVRELPTIQSVATDICVGDTISRQAAIDMIDNQIKQCSKALGSLSLSDVDKHAVEVKMASLRAYREMLENLPPAQPEPPIIKCKDCKWWRKQKDSTQGRCRLLGIYPTGAWYCGNAERRTDGKSESDL